MKHDPRMPVSGDASHDQLNGVCAVTTPKGSTGLQQRGVCDRASTLVEQSDDCTGIIICSGNV